MKLGILQCDSVLTQYQARFGNYPDMLIELFKRVDPSFEFRVFDVQHGHYPDQVSNCDGYITTGSKASAYDDAPWITTLSDYIKTLASQKIKLVGICFGHQLIAQTLGGETQKADAGWGVGVMSMPIKHIKAWMHPLQSTYALLVSHQDQVIKLPDQAELLAGDTFCPNAMYQIGNHILSLQGHPEFSKDYAATLMDHRAENIGSLAYQQGKNSLQQPVDDNVLVQWILAFFAQH